MKQIKILTCGLLASLGLLAVAPPCQAQTDPNPASSYAADPGGAMITAQSPLINENHSNYSVMSGATAAVDGTLTGQSLYTAKGGKTGNSGGNGGLRVEAAITAQYYWDGGGTGPPYTFRFFPGYMGTASGGQGTYSVDVKMSATQSGIQRLPSPNSPQDDWGAGRIANFSFQSRGPVDGPTGNFGTAEGDQRSYPCEGTDSFTVKTDFTSSGTTTAAGIGATASLQETITLYKDIAIDG